VNRYALTMLLMLSTCAQPAFTRDNGQWSEQSPQRRQWFNDLRQPDNPKIGCCGEADAYEADLFEVDPDGSIIAIITDGTGNNTGKATIPDGTRFKVPADRVVTGKQAQNNPTGHGWLFIGHYDDDEERLLYCFVMGNLL
jgi:hypothetical protein